MAETCRIDVRNTTSSEFSHALPAAYYRDPAECVDMIREEKKRKQRDRKHKAARIQALTKQVMERGVR